MFKYLNYLIKYINNNLVLYISETSDNVLNTFFCIFCKSRIASRKLKSITGSSRSCSNPFIIVSDVVELMKYSLWNSYQDERGELDFSRSQHGKYYYSIKLYLY